MRGLQVSTVAAMCIAALLGCASGTPRDQVPEGARDVRADGTTTSNDYEHVARRPHVTVALAEARGLVKSEVIKAVESLADRLEGCTRELSPSEGGIVRVVARVGDDGTVEGLGVPVQSGHAPTALRCLVSPIKLLVLPREAGESAGSPGFALEAEWRP